MNTIEIFTMLNNLPDDMQTEIADYIESLQQKAEKENRLKNLSLSNELLEAVKIWNSKNLKPKKEAIPGLAKGLIKMSPDFDEPLDGFNEYMP